MATALDYSAGRPSASAVLAAGHAGVIRYIGTPGRTKNITKAEYQDMTSRGVGVALVYENHAGDAGGGFSAGVTAARNARADANSIGFPGSRPIYFAVDSDQVSPANFAAVSAYLDGAASILGDRARVGVYGEYDVIEKNVGSHAAYGWQTAAWSGGKRSSKAAIFQRLGQTYVGGIQVDINDILASDWGQHSASEGDMTPDEFLNTKVTWWDNQAVTVKNLLAEVFISARGLNGRPAFDGQTDIVALPPLVDIKAAVTKPVPAVVDLDALAAKVAALAPTIDYAALAKAVNDDNARRMES